VLDACHSQHALLAQTALHIEKIQTNEKSLKRDRSQITLSAALSPIISILTHCLTETFQNSNFNSYPLVAVHSTG
jgi:hypothetical protein